MVWLTYLHNMTCKLAHHLSCASHNGHEQQSPGWKIACLTLVNPPSTHLSLCLLLPLTSSSAPGEGREKKKTLSIAFSSLIDIYFPRGGGRRAKRRENIRLDNLWLAPNQSCVPPVRFVNVAQQCGKSVCDFSPFTFCEWGQHVPPGPQKPFIVIPAAGCSQAKCRL